MPGAFHRLAAFFADAAFAEDTLSFAELAAEIFSLTEASRQLLRYASRRHAEAAAAEALFEAAFLRYYFPARFAFSYFSSIRHYY
jgi:hypothetical protein